jgi:hypothetical protein
VIESASQIETISVINTVVSSPSASVSSRARIYHSRKVKERAKEEVPLKRKPLQSKASQSEAFQPLKEVQSFKETPQPRKALQPFKALQPKVANSKNAVKAPQTAGAAKKSLKERRAASPTLEYSGVTKSEPPVVTRKKATVTKKTLSTAITIYSDQENVQPEPVGKKIIEKRVINTSTTVKKIVAVKPSMTLRRAVGGASRKPLR